MNQKEAQAAIDKWKPLLDYYRKNPRARTLMGNCPHCSGKGCVWCGNFVRKEA